MAAPLITKTAHELRYSYLEKLRPGERRWIAKKAGLEHVPESVSDILRSLERHMNHESLDALLQTPVDPLPETFENLYERGVEQHIQVGWVMTETANFQTFDIFIGIHALQLLPFTSKGITLVIGNDSKAKSSKTAEGYLLELPWQGNTEIDYKRTITSKNNVDFILFARILEDLRSRMKEIEIFAYQSTGI